MLVCHSLPQVKMKGLRRSRTQRSSTSLWGPEVGKSMRTWVRSQLVRSTWMALLKTAHSMPQLALIRTKICMQLTHRQAIRYRKTTMSMVKRQEMTMIKSHHRLSIRPLVCLLPKMAVKSVVTQRTRCQGTSRRTMKNVLLTPASQKTRMV